MVGAVTRVRTALSSAAVALAAVASAPLLAVGYDRPLPAFTVLALTAALAVAVTSVAYRMLRGLGPAAISAGLPVAAVWLVALASWAPGPVKGPVPAAVDAVLHSGARILTTSPRAPVTVDLLAFPVAAVWLAAAIATVLCREGRVLPALLPGALLLCGATALNPQAAGPGYWAAALVAAGGAVLLAAAPQVRPDTASAGFTVRVGDPADAGSTPARRRPRPRIGAAVAAVACAAALPGAVAVVGGSGVLEDWPVKAADPRRAAGPPAAPAEERNPLSYLSAWSADPDVPLLSVSGPRTELRWAVLSEFTGPSWLPDNTYLPSGASLLPPVDMPPKTVRTRMRVSVGTLPGGWVPVPGVPSRVDGLAVQQDEDSGSLLSSDGPVAGRKYSVTGDVPEWSGSQTAEATIASGEGYQRYLRLPPGAPPKLEEIARSAAGDGTAHQRASRLAAYLRASYTFKPGAPGGHGYAELTKLLVTPGRRGGGATSEQFASAFAVLARAAGLPSRVAVGFGPGSGGRDRVVRTGDAVAWGEIYFRDLGWVPYDPNPRERSQATPQTGSGKQVEEGGDQPDGPDAQGLGDQGGAGGGGRTGPGSRAESLFVLPALALLAFLLGTPMLGAIRFRRLHRGAAPDRIRAAWTELLVATRVAGLPVPASATPVEMAGRLARELPRTDPERLRRVGGLVNAVRYGGSVTPEDAAFTVAEVRSVTVALRRSRPLPRRLLWWWDPRAPLWAAQPARLPR
ncbi:DUF3488 and transglutaminase-like domain-containing protein [Actinomadura citrea]|uniref:Transglutaminase-like domain-containing protein n=1 Tax=Actinomadura citrea TaxID=46158 RepID=A0A7Y9KFR2_9ACTN|nr:transglutaminaseTgpA domain-containing protein [Actinomadura citrea]NYE17647.1 hypothetical protein [Actinomadura citrea]GGT60781.1 hypothetical protein GCM10010177_16440 [Actinomadura citrea]